ncbi:MAG TPA: tail fiber domain-containing protein, partial [Chthonomonadaceae bacterium]|nr:tail fiber domain-containing protein [Chthonomonadaceae bacterium]
AQTATFIAGIDGATSLNGLTVFINANGQLGTRKSSRRFKKDIHDMGSASDRLMQLRPVTYRYKQAAEDGSYPLQYGLIAEEVAKVYPDLVQYDKAGKPLAIYDHLLAPMLLNELQKQHRQNQAQKTQIAAQQKEMAALKATLHKQSAESAALQSEVVALKQSQQQQLNALTRRIALLEAFRSKSQPHQAVAILHNR